MMPRTSDLEAPKYTGRAFVVVTTFERLKKFDVEAFHAVVVDESGMLRGAACARNMRGVVAPYRLALTATPCAASADDIVQHAEFLGIPMDKATFFNKRHQLRPEQTDAYMTFLLGWTCWLRNPADIGFPRDAARFVLPPLTITNVTIDAATAVSVAAARAAAVVDIMSDDGTAGPWVVWCRTGEESTLITAAVPGAVELKGSLKPEARDAILGAVVDGTPYAGEDIKVLVTKTSIAGLGLNMQRVNRMIFASLSANYNTFYQSVRRSFRLGQCAPLVVYTVTTDAEAKTHETIMTAHTQGDAVWDELLKRMLKEHGTAGGSTE